MDMPSIGKSRVLSMTQSRKFSTVFKSLIDMVGNTPILQASKLQTGKCHLFLKLENQNPGGSIKDRVALSMIEAAEREGKLKPGYTIIEATAGNTGLGLALIAALKGYKILLVMPDKMSLEKIAHLRALGAEIKTTRSDVGKGHPEYYQDLAEDLSKTLPNSFYVNQFSNRANTLAHETMTGPEMFEQMDGKIDAVVCGVGSGGTLAGLSKYFAKVSPQTRLVLADPEGSILTEYIKTKTLGKAGSWLIEGIGEDFIPEIADLSRVSHAYTISDKESFQAARELLLKEGVFAGSSSGTILAAALRYCREAPSEQRVVALVPDSGGKYLSKMFNDYWLADQGFIKSESFGDLRDFVSRPSTKSAVTSVTPNDSLLTAFNRMRLHEYSQLPVLEGEKVVGLVDEYDLLIAIEKDAKNYHQTVSNFMTKKIDILKSNTNVDQLWNLLRENKVGVLEHEGKFYGLITRSDALTHMRKKIR
jgi:cystathionine beta-synthase